VLASSYCEELDFYPIWITGDQPHMGRMEAGISLLPRGRWHQRPRVMPGLVSDVELISCMFRQLFRQFFPVLQSFINKKFFNTMPVSVEMEYSSHKYCSFHNN